MERFKNRVSITRFSLLGTILSLCLLIPSIYCSELALQVIHKPCDGAVFLVVDVGVELSNNVFEVRI